ncbi:MAG: hypothetical protein ACJAS4_000179 [Bacteriovoracaceae bacterium]|jgi:hypothetical protein
MKKLNLNIILLLLTSALYIGCEDNIPRDRPTFDISESVSTEVEEEDESVIEEEAVPSRPSGAIIIQSNHCACAKGKPISIGNCTNICQEKSSSSDETKKFFFEVDLTPAITETNLLDVFGFCNTLDGETSVASCSVEVKDEAGNIDYNLAFAPASGSKSFTLDVGALAEDQTYRLTIVEASSGARSTTVQLRLTSDLIVDTVGGPLALMPVNQYSCLFRSGSIDSTSGELIVDNVNRFHFYFIPETRPEPLQQASLPSVNCYDIELYGTTPINSPLLEESTGAFSVWNKADPRFFDLDGDNVIQIHNLLEQSMLLQGQALATPPTLFFPLSWPNGFDDGDTNPSDSADTATTIEVSSSDLGYYMTPFLDSDTFKAYCPKKEHYYSDSPLFKAMREVVSLDTEGLYAAKQDNVCDFILIKESLLKKIWFYIEGGEHIEPTNNTISGKKVQFYWPADTASPFIKKSHQRIYTIKSSQEITCGSNTTPESSGQNGDGVRTNIPPHDKRIGCIPMLAD